MSSRDGFEFLQTRKFALVRPGMIKRGAVNDLHRSQRAHDVAPQPHFAVAATANQAQQFMVRNLWGYAELIHAVHLHLQFAALKRAGATTVLVFLRSNESDVCICFSTADQNKNACVHRNGSAGSRSLAAIPHRSFS
jgi:hypothetical protein